MALIRVKDEGQGIRTEHLDQIFEPFKRVANDNDKGLGVGLFITKQIVERHGGKIHVESKIGKGSTFTISLPL